MTDSQHSRQQTRYSGEQLAVYIGRQGDPAALPEGVRTLGAWDVLPFALNRTLAEAEMLVILDSLSFPFESLETASWDVPIALAIAEEQLTDEELVAVFDDPILSRLTFYDKIATTDDALWQRLRRRYGWAEWQRIRSDTDRHESIIAEMSALLARDDAFDEALVVPHADPISYWLRRGSSIGSDLAHRAVGSMRHGLRDNKAMHRVQQRALSPIVERALRLSLPNNPLRALEIGCGVGRWAGLFRSPEASYTGLDVSADMIEVASQNFPDAEFSVLEDPASVELPTERFDLVFTVTVLHHNRPETRLEILREMYRLVRPGGMLVFLEDFVASRTEGATVQPVSVLEFQNELMEASRGSLVLDHVDTLKYGYDDIHRAGVLACTKVAVPQNL